MRPLLIFLSIALALAVTAQASADCERSAFGSGTVASVRDGRTFVLTDGREVRLLGIEAGSNDDTLRRLVAGKALRLERPAGQESGIDRYGRLVAFAFLPDGRDPVQKTLLAEGAARVSARAGGKSCADALLAAEREARAARRGLWADPNFAPLSSENLPGLSAARGHFALVEGQVLSVRESGATIYVNFGTRWTRDFTVIILKRQRRTFAAAGIDLDKLRGRRIRVRGVIEQRGGPIIEAAAPEQIEPID
jgi:endonuclease YncB( thermonuclease family)